MKRTRGIKDGNKKEKKNCASNANSSFTVRFLESVIDMVDSVIFYNISRHQAYEKLHDINPIITKKRSAKWLGDLRREGYIQIVKRKSGNESIILTNKTKMKMLDKITKKLQCDSSNRFLSFDIPEEMRSQRNRFRRIIKEMGFVKIQQSLWVTNKEVGELVEMAARECGVGRYTAYIVSNKSDIDNIVSKKLRRSSNKNRYEENERPSIYI